MSTRSTDTSGISPRRRQLKRRRFSFATLRGVLTHGRRRDGRRDEDQHGYYVDRFEPFLIRVAIAILVLSAVDVMLTLRLMEYGAVEVNPVLAFLMEIDITLFTVVKLVTTLLALIILVAHVKFRLFRVVHVSLVIYGILPIYLLLVAYELTLLALYT